MLISSFIVLCQTLADVEKEKKIPAWTEVVLVPKTGKVSM